MRAFIAVLAIGVVAGCGSDTSMAKNEVFGLAVHGGAGTLTRKNLDAETERAIRTRLTEALAAGHEVLSAGGSSLDAVVVAVAVLEDSPLFNAGKGAVYTWEETHELDASLMDGSTMSAGAVASVRNVRNPIRLARIVMEQSPHVMLAGAGADEFARGAGVELVENSWFGTDFRLQQLRRAKETQDLGSMLNPLAAENKFGTVGAVALDKEGRLAAATSTGGTTGKRWGRVGDSPIIGAGTYADSQCAVSATGHGEFFIRHVVAHDICARRAYRNVSLATAADEVVMDVLVKAGGDGGVVAIDRNGDIAMPFNSEGMYRGFQKNADQPVVQIFGDE